jgi:transcriptional regulator with XRE-family HTH domain
MRINSTFSVKFFDHLVAVLHTTDRQVGIACQFANGYIYKLKQGKINPSTETLDRLATGLLGIARSQGLVSKHGRINRVLREIGIHQIADFRTQLLSVKISRITPDP